LVSSLEKLKEAHEDSMQKPSYLRNMKVGSIPAVEKKPTPKVLSNYLTLDELKQ